MTFPVFAGNSASTGYNLTRSLRFRQSASASLSRTPSATGNRQIFTYSAWIKRGALDATFKNLLYAYVSTSDVSYISINSSNQLSIAAYNGGSFVGELVTTQVFRDPSAWYHFVIAVDTTQATASNRIKMYVNGSQITALATATYPPQNTNFYFNAQYIHRIAASDYPSSPGYFDGYIAEQNWIDGQALTPSSFGSTNATTGVWQPAAYTGSYGTNGFYLPFTDNSGITNLSTGNNGIGKDFSGNGNYWTTNNLSLYGGTVQSFTSSTTWTAPAGVTSVQYFVVAGGGGGGSFGGGGGGGGVAVGTLSVTPGTSYTVTVGAGGAGGAGTGYNTGTQGSNSVFSSITAIGGGAGSSQGANAGSGGSGGGGAGTGSTTTGGAGTAGQGFAGGSGDGASSGGFPAGGGGGASEAGKNFSGNTGGIGGAGRSSSISGSLVTYGGGGGGGANSAGGNPGVGGAGGAGGGGAGSSSAAGTAGTANTGGGGGGGGNITAGGAGGSGIVIIAYGSSVTYDSMTDVPTLTSATAANFAVLNPLFNSTPTLSAGNLNYSVGSTTTPVSAATIGVSSGKWYWEITATSTGNNVGIIGLSDTRSLLFVGGSATSYSYFNSGVKYNNAVGTSYGASYTTNDVIGVALDLTAGTLTFYKNNTSQGTAFSSLSGTFFPACGNDGTTSNCVFNFGQRPFTYTPPSGFVALNTFNLPTSTIVKGNTVFDATTYTGTGASLSVTNTAAFKPDLVWVKSRSAATDNKLTDSVRGVTKGLISNTTGTETTDTQGLTAFNSNGFTVGTNTTYNNLSATYVAWQWQAGQGTNTSNTNGTITSTVSVNASAGFSVVTYTGTGANATVGHGLGVAPSMYIVKRRNGAVDWGVYHSSLTSAAYGLYLNTTNAQFSAPTYWNSTAPTSSVFSIGTDSLVNASGGTMVAYCWTPIAGYSAFGSYSGSGSTDGPFIYTNFQPKWVLIKRTDSTGNWDLYDSARSPYNAMDLELFPNSSSAEYDGDRYFDFLSNGFKPRTTVSDINASGGTYIYMAFATSPFKNSLAR